MIRPEAGHAAATIPAGSGEPRLISIAVPSDSGRCVAVAAEVGCLLAIAGRSVLLVDAGPEESAARGRTMRAHLRPFPSFERHKLKEPEQPLAALAGAAAVFRYQLPIPDRHLDVLAADPSPDTQSAPEQFTPLQVRAAVARLQYDFVVMSAPIERWREEPELFGPLIEVGIVCVPATAASVPRVGAAIGRLRAAGATPRLVGVVCHTAGGDARSAAKVRAEIRSTLASSDDLGDQPPVVELAGRDHTASQPLLPFLLDQPQIDPAGGYQQLLAAVTAGRVGMPAIPMFLRRRYQHRLGRLTSIDPDLIWVAYPVAQREWAEWVVTELRRAGAVADLMAVPPPDPDRDPAIGSAALVLLGPARSLPEPVQAWLGAYPDRLPAAMAPELVQLQLPGTSRRGDIRPDVVPVDLPANEAEARSRLLGPFVLSGMPDEERADTADQAVRWSARFPGRPPHPISNLPPPNRDFVGREHELELLRAGLLRNPVQFLTGPPAVGKSEIARSYSGRFAFDYDVVWWVAATDPTSIQAELGKLDRERGDNARESQRILLVYDDADQLDELPERPQAGGNVHIVVTARAPGRHVVESPISVAALDDLTGEQLLARRHPGLSVDDARGLVVRLGGEPLALRLAAAALRESVTRQWAHGLTGAVSSERAVSSYLAALAGPPASAVEAAAWATVDLLASGDLPESLAVWLARLCAFTSPSGLSLNLLRSSAVTAALAGLADQPAREALTVDTALVDTAVWQAARAGLIDVDWGAGNRIRMHRVVQSALTSAMSSEERLRCREALLIGLAGTVPNDAELEITASRERLDELLPHLGPSGAVASEHRAARRWVLSQVQYAARTGDEPVRRGSLELAARAEQLWVGETERDADLVLRLEAERARILYELGGYAEAAQRQLSVLERLRSLLGTGHLRTLLAARSAARYLRGMGDLAAARVQDHAAYEGFARLLGRGHPNTLRAANNLAFSLFLAGHVTEAAWLQNEIRLRLVDDPGSERNNFWVYVANLGAYLRELGRYDEAKAHLEQARLGVANATTLHLRRLHLRIQRNFALIHREKNRGHLAQSDSSGALSDHIELLGETDLDTLAATLALAADEHAAGHADAAVARAESAAAGLHEVLPDRHPYRYLCQTALGAFQLAAGQAKAARDTTEGAWQGLATRLGELHPWTQAAGANRLHALAATEPLAEVLPRYHALAERCQEYLTASYPYTRIVAENLATLRNDDGSGLTANRLQPIIVDIPWV